MEYSVQEAEKGYRNIVDLFHLTEPSRTAAAASEHVDDQTKSHGGGSCAHALHVGGNGTGSRGRSSTSRGGSRVGGGSRASGRGGSRGRGVGRCGAVVGGVEGAASVLDSGGAVGLALRVADVGADALCESLSADKL